MKARRRREGLGIRVLPLLFFVGTALGLAACRAPAQVSQRAVSFEGVGGFPLHGTLYVPRGEHPPGIILLHALGSDRSAWASFAKQAADRGYMALAFDMRGHGASAEYQGKRVTFREFGPGEWQAMAGDVGRAKEALLEAGADPENVAVAGASLGANVALTYARDDPEIQAVVMVSPGADYHGFEILPIMQDFRRRPVLILAAEGDSYSADTGRRMKEAAEGFSELRLYAGSAHGTDLLVTARAATGQIFLWLNPILRAADGGSGTP